MARSSGPGTLATVRAHSKALDDPTVTVQKAQSADVPGDPSPAIVIDQTWQVDGVAPKAAELVLDLVGVASLTVDGAGAGLGSAPRVALALMSDGPATVRLTGLRPGAVVVVGGTEVRADGKGVAVVRTEV